MYHFIPNRRYKVHVLNHVNLALWIWSTIQCVLCSHSIKWNSIWTVRGWAIVKVESNEDTEPVVSAHTLMVKFDAAGGGKGSKEVLTFLKNIIYRMLSLISVALSDLFGILLLNSQD